MPDTVSVHFYIIIVSSLLVFALLLLFLHIIVPRLIVLILTTLSLAFLILIILQLTVDVWILGRVIIIGVFHNRIHTREVDCSVKGTIIILIAEDLL